jgi:hypothetical protein
LGKGVGFLRLVEREGDDGVVLACP